MSGGQLTQKGVFAISKALIESHAFNKGKFNELIQKFLLQLSLEQ